MFKHFLVQFIPLLLVFLALSFYYGRGKKKDLKFFAVILFASIIGGIVGAFVYYLLGGD